MGNGIVNQFVDGFLIHLIAVSVCPFPGGPAHAAVTQYGYAVACCRVGAVDHFVGRYLA